jgi:uncharacterized repeat protein (TIGR03803 family)
MTRPTILVPTLRSAACFSILMLAVFFLGSTELHAQTGHILHSFTGSPGDGSGPQGLVVVDQAGNVYGSRPFGANHGGICAALGGCGMVFREVNRNGAFVYNPLYLFHGSDGAQPFAGVAIGPNGVVYGTTLFGGGMGCGGNGCGVIFKLTPPLTFCRMVFCSWDETVIYSPRGSSDPSGFFSTVLVDNAGNLYGVSFSGGSFENGTVYKLSPSGGGNYTETTLYSFTGGDDGGEPMGDIAMDAAGNIYGTAAYGGADGFGTVFKLVRSAGGYTFQLLYTFTGGPDGAIPQGNVVLDSAGNLYGASGDGGGIFQITPSGTYTLIDTQAQSLQAPISIDATGNLYGTTYGGGQRGDGSMFKDTYTGGSWTHNVIFSFDGANGGLPLSDVGFDASRNMYVTSTAGGQGGQGQGTLVQVTP